MSGRPRLRLTGFVSFVVRMASLASGLIFSVIVARRLSEEDFGAWTYVGRLVSYFAVTASFISFWAGRDAGRGGKPLKTALAGSVLMSLILSIAYLGVVAFSAEAIGREPWVVMLGLIQLPILHLLNTAEGVSYGHKPIASAYGFAVFEVAKVTFAVVAVYFLGLGLAGVFISLALAQLLQASILIYLQRNTLDSFRFGDLLRWLKGFAVPLLTVLGGFVYGLDVFLGGVLYGSALPLAYWQAALTVALVVGMYNNLVLGLYPVLLGGGGSRDIEKVFRFAMLLGVPLLFGALILGRDILQLLRPAYAEASSILVVLSISYFINGLSYFFTSVVGGLDEVDKRSDVSLADYLRSGIFRYNLFYLVLASAYVAAFSLATMYAKSAAMTQVETAQLWAYAHLGFSISLTTVGYLFSRRRIKFQLPTKPLAKYIIAALLMTAAIAPIYLIIPQSNTAIIQLTRIGAILLTGAAAYTATIMLIDTEAKAMIKLVFNRLFS
jgi:O-antigen/teichoic acid export membrane protein